MSELVPATMVVAIATLFLLAMPLAASPRWFLQGVLAMVAVLLATPAAISLANADDREPTVALPDAAYGLMVAPSGDPTKWGTIGYGIPERGWGQFAHRIAKQIEASERRPDFVLIGTPGPVFGGVMALNAHQHCLSLPPWADARLPRPVLYWSYGQWRKAIPGDIDLYFYVGRIETPEIMAMHEADAVRLVERTVRWYVDRGADGLVFDSASTIGGDVHSGIASYRWTQREDNEVADKVAEIVRTPEDFGLKFAAVETWPSSYRGGSNRLTKGVPAVVMARHTINTPIRSPQPTPHCAPLKDHPPIVMCRRDGKAQGDRYPLANEQFMGECDAAGTVAYCVDWQEWAAHAKRMPARQ